MQGLIIIIFFPLPRPLFVAETFGFYTFYALHHTKLGKKYFEKIVTI